MGNTCKTRERNTKYAIRLVLTSHLCKHLAIQRRQRRPHGIAPQGPHGGLEVVVEVPGGVFVDLLLEPGLLGGEGVAGVAEVAEVGTGGDTEEASGGEDRAEGERRQVSRIDEGEPKALMLSVAAGAATSRNWRSAGPSASASA